MLSKLRNNLLSWDALSVLGPAQYARYLTTFVSELPDVVRSGDLRPVDKLMGRSARRFRYRRREFLFDCAYCDEHIKDGSFAFGLAREIYIRDCYLRWHNVSLLRNLSTVFDLGANRGAFSALMAGLARFIVCVEARPQFAPVIGHNLDLNNANGYAIEIAIVGDGAVFVAKDPSPRSTIAELFEKHGTREVDFLKMDIEGSEFDLFDSASWLDNVHALSLEVHPAFGDPRLITARLKEHGFSQRIANNSLRLVSSPSDAAFVYAWKDR
jgi:hypothetical protein